VLAIKLFPVKSGFFQSPIAEKLRKPLAAEIRALFFLKIFLLFSAFLKLKSN